MLQHSALLQCLGDMPFHRSNRKDYYVGPNVHGGWEGCPAENSADVVRVSSLCICNVLQLGAVRYASMEQLGLCIKGLMVRLPLTSLGFGSRTGRSV